VTDGGLSLPTLPTSGQTAVQLVRYELPEARTLERSLDWLEAHSLTVSDYFVKREELVTGELSPAKYILLPDDSEPMELENLARVAAGVRELGQRGVSIKRFKGLGEMNPDELWETTLDPKCRQLLQVVISEELDDLDQVEVDWRAADRIFSILMGTDVEVRRSFIETNAIHVKDLDV
jgi:DNA gyrase subunit B